MFSYSGSLQLGAPAATGIPAVNMWATTTAAPAMFSMPGVQAVPGMPGVPLPGARPAFPQPSAFGGVPIPPTAWGQQMQPQFAVPPLSPPHLAWGQPAANAATNPFQPGAFPGMGDQQGPARPPPRPPGKDAPPKVENSAFTSLDPLGDKEKKSGKDMFKDFQLAKPPAIPARKGEVAAAPASKQEGAFDQYFSSKVGLVQDVADHDDFVISQISTVVNGKLQTALNLLMLLQVTVFSFLLTNYLVFVMHHHTSSYSSCSPGSKL